MEAKVLNVQCHKPMISIDEGNWKLVRQYFRKGFFVSEKENGKLILSKKPQILVTLECHEKVFTVNYTGKLINHYGKQELETLIQLFEADLKKGKCVLIDSEGCHHIV